MKKLSVLLGVFLCASVHGQSSGQPAGPVSAVSSPAPGPDMEVKRVELDREGETIVLEPYAANIVRVTLSLKHEPAVAPPGYGIIATPAADGWTMRRTAEAVVYSSARMVVRVATPHPRAGGPPDDGAKYFIGSTPGANITFRTPQGETLLELTGSIVPLGSAIENTHQKQWIAKVKVYPGADGSFTLFEDDGMTYAYEKGAGEITRLRWDDAGRKLTHEGAAAWNRPDGAIVEIKGR